MSTQDEKIDLSAVPSDTIMLNMIFTAMANHGPELWEKKTAYLAILKKELDRRERLGANQDTVLPQ